MLDGGILQRLSESFLCTLWSKSVLCWGFLALLKRWGWGISGAYEIGGAWIDRQKSRV